MRQSSRWKAAVATLALSCAPCFAADGPIDTPRLLEYCDEAQLDSGKANPFRAGYCYAFVEGVLRGWEAGAYVRDAPVNYCIPDGVTLGQIVGAISSTIRSNPSQLSGRAEVSVIAAVQKSYPCGQPQR